MDDTDKPAPQPKDTRTNSQIAADRIERLEELKDQWEQFESPKELRRRRLRQAEILGETMWKLGNSVSERWHTIMEVVAARHNESEGKKTEGERWLVTRERLEADGWEFKKNSRGEIRLHPPPYE